MGDMTKNFSRREFACKCGCGEDNIMEDFVRTLQQIRNRSGVTMTVTSGVRCKQHNKFKGGKDNSAHLFGVAADFHIENSRDRYKLIEAAMKFRIPRIGIGPDFIHLDMAGSLPQEVLWDYYD